MELTNTAFAEYFTILSRFALAVGSTALPANQPGSISFGVNGFSLVSDHGQTWIKIDYRQLKRVRVHPLYTDSVEIELTDQSFRLAFAHPYLPDVIAGLLVPLKRQRALIFIELLNRIRDGLTATEVAMYQNRLQA